MDGLVEARETVPDLKRPRTRGMDGLVEASDERGVPPSVCLELGGLHLPDRWARETAVGFDRARQTRFARSHPQRATRDEPSLR
jgi:hypothetical protein